MPEIIQPINGRAGIRTQSGWLSNPLAAPTLPNLVRIIIPGERRREVLSLTQGHTASTWQPRGCRSSQSNSEGPPGLSLEPEDVRAQAPEIGESFVLHSSVPNPVAHP